MARLRIPFAGLLYSLFFFFFFSEDAAGDVGSCKTGHMGPLHFSHFQRHVNEERACNESMSFSLGQDS